MYETDVAQLHVSEATVLRIVGCFDSWTSGSHIGLKQLCSLTVALSVYGAMW